MQDKLSQIKRFFLDKGYRCRNFKDVGLVVKGYEGDWRIWINYDGDIVWYGVSWSTKKRIEIENQIRSIAHETELG